MSILIRCEAVAYYAARVRAELAGVDPEVVEDLTDGLEADLTEALLDELPEGEEPAEFLTALELDTLDARFGSPDSYASELAQAAGVAIAPVTTTAKRRPLRTALTQAKAGVRADAAAFAARHRWARELVATLRVLRPVWWLARGFGLALVVASIVGWSSGDLMPRNVGAWVLALTFTFVSVQWGQKRFGQGRWTRRLGLLLGWVAAIAVLLGHTLAGQSRVDRAWNEGFQAAVSSQPNDFDPSPATSAFGDGRPISNLFVFGPDGLPIDGAQIVDQDGQPVVLTSPDGENSWAQWRDSGSPDLMGDVPAALLQGDGRLNVFPYSFVKAEDVAWSPEELFTLAPGGTENAPRWPANTLFPIPGAAVSPSVEPEPSGSPDPAATDPAATDPNATAPAPEAPATPSGESTS